MNNTAKKLHIAIVLSDTLGRIGLEALLHRVSERIRIESYDTFERFRSLGSDNYDIVFLEDTLLALYGDLFRGKKARLIPLLSFLPTPDALPDDEAGIFIYGRWSRRQIESILLDTLENHSHAISGTTDKGLSTRELEVLTEVARGLTNKEIADALNISMNTVMSHRKNITAKLNIKTVSGLTFYALMNGLISGEEVVEKASD